jgi:hypothetical protein
VSNHPFCLLTILVAIGGCGRASAVTLPPPPASPPTLVQHVASSTNPLGVGISGNNFKFTLPNKVLAGNCLILGISYSSSGTLAATPITDTNGNTWPTSPAVSVSDTNANVNTAIFVLPNANAGVTTITVSFTAALLPFQYTISEFYNVALSSPVNGTSSNSAVTAPGLTSGSFTPGDNDANGGNLIWTYAYDDSNAGSGNAVTTFTAGTNFTLLDADITWGTQANAHHASEYFVQTTAAAINPGMTATMSPANDTFNVASVALKAASAGTPPAATGIRIVRVSHCTNSVPPTTSWKIQFPSSGNLIVAVTNENSVINITSVTDNKGNTYNKAEPDGSEPQFWWAGNAAPDADLKLSLNISGTPATTTVVLYDIVGAATSPLDGVVGTVAATDINGANLINTPSIARATAPGLTIASVSLAQGPSSGLDIGSPAGAIFDLVYYTGETDFDTMDNADGKAHFYNSDTTTENWNWIVSNGAVTTLYASCAVHFAAQR